MNRTLRVVALFCFAGFLSAYVFGEYSAWVSELYRALPSQNGPPNGYVTSEAYNNWYHANVALTPYADRKWPILCLGFPIAMTLALLLATMAGWVKGFRADKWMSGLLPIYVAPVMVLGVSAVTWFLLLIPTLVLAAWLLALSLKRFTSTWSTRFFLGFLLSAAAAIGLSIASLYINTHGSNREATSANVFLISLEVLSGGLLGLGLVVLPRP